MFFRGGANAEAIDTTVLAAFPSTRCISADGAAESGAASAAKPKASPTWVLQAYVIPATVRSRKFHIRLPILAIGSLTVLMHSNCRVICATLPWSESYDAQDVFVHVTNLNVNCKHPDYNAWNQNFSLWALPPHVSVLIWSAMRLIVARLFRRVAAVRRHFFTLPNCFELFGLDFTVSSDGELVFYIAD